MKDKNLKWYKILDSKEDLNDTFEKAFNHKGTVTIEFLTDVSLM